MKKAITLLLATSLAATSCGPAAKAITKAISALADDAGAAGARVADDVMRVADDAAHAADDALSTADDVARAKPKAPSRIHQPNGSSLVNDLRTGPAAQAQAERAAIESRSATCVGEHTRTVGMMAESTRRQLQGVMQVAVKTALRRLSNAELRAIRDGGEKGQEAMIEALRGVAVGLKQAKTSWSIDLTKAELSVSMKLPGNGSAKASLPLDKLLLAIAGVAGYHVVTKDK
jgi:hypothetical protein